MGNVNLTDERKAVIFGKDDVIVPKYIAGIAGGRGLDVTGISDEVLHAGHIIITDGAGNYKPLAYTTTLGVKAYGEKPGGWSYAGVLYRSILKKKQSAAIMISGVVNDAAVEIPYGAHKTALKSAIPTIMFVKDEVADSTAPVEESESSSSAN